MNVELFFFKPACKRFKLLIAVIVTKNTTFALIYIFAAQFSLAVKICKAKIYACKDEITHFSFPPFILITINIITLFFALVKYF